LQHPSDDLDISIIMPVYNGEAFIVESLPPLIEMQKRGEVREVIVVDDSSTDDSPRLAARGLPGTRRPMWPRAKSFGLWIQTSWFTTMPSPT
jgi:hypothetical protein